MDENVKTDAVDGGTTRGGTPTPRLSVPGNDRPSKQTTRILIGAGIALVVALLLFFLGSLVGRSELEETRANYETRMRNARAEVEQVRSQLAATQAENRLLVTRGWLYRAAIQLDRRNFGLAQNHLKQAALTLERTDPGPAGIDTAEINALRRSIENTTIRVATDIQSQRDKILQLAEQMTDLLKTHSRQADIS